MLNCQQHADIAPKFLIDGGLSALLNSLPIYPQHLVTLAILTLFQVQQAVYRLLFAVVYTRVHAIATADTVFVLYLKG